jgi:hypothetical protein
MDVNDPLAKQLHLEWGAFWVIVNEGCRRFGGSVVSGIRSETRNVGVGGHPESRHLKGLAADVTFLPDRERDARERCDECFAFFYERGLYGYQKPSGTSLHIQDRSAKAPQ